MGSERWCHAMGEIGEELATTVAVALTAARTRAGKVSSRRTDRLTTPAISMRGRLLCPRRYRAPSGNRRSWQSRFQISCYAGQFFGLWQNQTELKGCTPASDNLAAVRRVPQVDENYQFNGKKPFLAQWFVYEPPYSFNSAGPCLLVFWHSRDPPGHR
jgi:hypothetical protein